MRGAAGTGAGGPPPTSPEGERRSPSLGTIRFVSERAREPDVCERCGREVEPGSLWTLAIAVPPDGRVERAICVVCAAEVRRFLLGNVPTAQPVAPPPPEADAEAAGADVALSPRRRATGVLLRWAFYVGVAACAFVIVTWLVAR
jgi:hypothetical protein